MVKKRPQTTRTIQNRRARHDYTLDDSLITGLELTGPEARSLRLGRGHLRGAYVTVKNNELWLINASIAGTSGSQISESEQTRARRVLAKRREIDAMIEAKQQGRTIVPLDILTGGRYIKLRLAVGKGRKNYDKRQAIKQREATRNIDRAIRYS